MVTTPLSRTLNTRWLNWTELLYCPTFLPTFFYWLGLQGASTHFLVTSSTIKKNENCPCDILLQTSVLIQFTTYMYMQVFPMECSCFLIKSTNTCTQTCCCTISQPFSFCYNIVTVNKCEIVTNGKIKKCINWLLIHVQSLNPLYLDIWRLLKTE